MALDLHPGGDGEAAVYPGGAETGGAHEALGAAGPAAGVSVLVVDDDPEIVRLLVDLLREEGHTVRGAHSLREALARAGSAPPDVALLDVSLPGEGLAAGLARLRARPGWERVPVVLCSGQERLEALARAVGAAGALRKPFNLDDVLDLVERCARRRPR